MKANSTAGSHGRGGSVTSRVPARTRSDRLCLVQRGNTTCPFQPCVGPWLRRSRKPRWWPHEDFGFSGCVSPYRSRSAFASSVRPNASSASVATRALCLVQAWSRPSTLSRAVRAVSPKVSASLARPMRSNRADRLQRRSAVRRCSGPSTFSYIASELRERHVDLLVARKLGALTEVRNALAVLRLMTSSNLAGREPQKLPGVPAKRKAATFLLFSVA